MWLCHAWHYFTKNSPYILTQCLILLWSTSCMVSRMSQPLRKPWHTSTVPSSVPELWLHGYHYTQLCGVAITYWCQMQKDYYCVCSIPMRFIVSHHLPACLEGPAWQVISNYHLVYGISAQPFLHPQEGVWGTCVHIRHIVPVTIIDHKYACGLS